MCGIAGVARLDGEPVSRELLGTMTRVLAHRGPDSSGVWTAGPIGFGHSRLAIVDLTQAAHQPMASPTAELVPIYNSELYNHLELRAELESLGHVYQSRSDTETVLRAYETWGTDCLTRFNGMFAIAVWDGTAQRLLLARDRYGVKPLYYHWSGSRITFASEIKAILACPDVPRRIC